MQRPLLNMAPLRRRFTLILAFAMVLVAPFAAMEAVNSSQAQAELPALLFAFMFAHAALIAAAVTPAVQQALRTQSVRSLNLLHWFGLVAGIVLLGIYIGVVLDQMPCFLGVPNCD